MRRPKSGAPAKQDHSDHVARHDSCAGYRGLADCAGELAIDLLFAGCIWSDLLARREQASRNAAADKAVAIAALRIDHGVAQIAQQWQIRLADIGFGFYAGRDVCASDGQLVRLYR